MIVKRWHKKRVKANRKVPQVVSKEPLPLQPSSHRTRIQRLAALKVPPRELLCLSPLAVSSRERQPVPLATPVTLLWKVRMHLPKQPATTVHVSRWLVVRCQTWPKSSRLWRSTVKYPKLDLDTRSPLSARLKSCFSAVPPATLANTQWLARLSCTIFWTKRGKNWPVSFDTI